MANIIPYIFKSKVDKTLQYPLKYSDVEECFSTQRVDDLYLEVYFSDRQAYWKADRDRLEAEGRYNLAELHYDPEDPDFGNLNAPWRDAENPVVVHARIYAVPSDVMMTVGLNRATLRAILVDQIDKLTPGSLFSRRWRLRIVLEARVRIIECASTVWTGLRQEPETRVQVSLDERKSAGSLRGGDR